MTELRLRGCVSGLVTTCDVWNEVLDLAEEFGWRPEHVPSLYRADVGLQITANDARNLARSLEKLAGYISTEEAEIDKARRTCIVGDLSRLIDLCDEGMFRIC